MSLLRTAGSLLGVVAFLLLVLTPSALGAPAQPACPVAAAPGPPVDASGVPLPGQAEPPSLPVPDPPVGGPGMGTCGVVSPDGVAPPPPVDVESYVLADLDTGEVLAAKLPHARLRPASLLKTLTGLLVARQVPMDEVITATQADADQEGTRVGIGPGGQYTARQLLDGLLMQSGNDIAHALAVRLTGSVEGTVEEMNRTAAALGAHDTRAATPSGLDGPGMSTSTYDLASIFRVALREPAFVQAVGTRQIPFPGFGTIPGFVVSNDNKIFDRYPAEAIGGKTGFTNDARHTYIGAVNRGGRRLVAVLMRGEQRPVPMVDKAAALLDYGFATPRGRSVGTLTDAATAGTAASPDGVADGATALGPVGSSGQTTTSRWSTPLTIGAIVVLALLIGAVRLRSRS